MSPGAPGAPGGLEVRGGAGGVVADVEAISASAATLADGALVLTGSVAAVGVAGLRRGSPVAAALDPGGALLVEQARWRALGPSGLAGSAAGCAALAATLELAARAYEQAEHLASTAVVDARDALARSAGAAVSSVLGPQVLLGAASVGLVVVAGTVTVWAVVRGGSVVGRIGDETVRALADGRLDVGERTALADGVRGVPAQVGQHARTDLADLGDALADEGTQLAGQHPELLEHAVGALPAFVTGLFPVLPVAGGGAGGGRTVHLPGGDRLAWPPSDVAGLAAAVSLVATADGLLRPTDVRLRAEGGPVVTPPARGVADLLRRGAPMAGGGDLSPGGRPDSEAPVRVERVTDASGARRWVLTLPPTQTVANPLTQVVANPADLGSDVRAVGQVPNAASRAGVLALRAAGVAPGEPVLVTGYSQGGIVAMQLACDEQVREEFTIAAVLTAGAPVGGFTVPDDVAALSLEHTEDWIAGLDGERNAPEPEHTTVRREITAGEGPGAAAARAALAEEGSAGHDLDLYTQTADLVDASDDVSIAAWRAQVAPFLDDGSGARTAVAQLYRARRVPS